MGIKGSSLGCGLGKTGAEDEERKPFGRNSFRKSKNRETKADAQYTQESEDARKTLRQPPPPTNQPLQSTPQRTTKSPKNGYQQNDSENKPNRSSNAPHVNYVTNPQSALNSQLALKSPGAAVSYHDNGRQSRGVHRTDVQIYTGNLLCVNVDAIVSPTNSQLRPQRGAAADIAAAAGPLLMQECEAFIQTHQSLPPGEVMHTSAGNIRHVTYVIHVVGPRRSQYRDDNSLEEAVRECFYSYLRYANEKLHIRSLGTPAIGAGNNGVPIETVARAALSAVSDFDKNVSDDRRYLREVHFINIDESATRSFLEVFKSYGGYNREVSSDSHTTKRQNSSDRSTSSKQQHSVKGQGSVQNLDDVKRRRASHVSDSASGTSSLKHQDNQSVNADGVPIIQDKISLENYLWRYIEKYHKADIDDVCKASAKYTYYNQSQELHITSCTGQPITKLCRHITRTIDDLRAKISDCKRPLPPGIDTDSLRQVARSVVETTRALFFIDLTTAEYHIVGPKDEVERLNAEVLGSISDDQFCTTAQADDVFQFNTSNGIQVQVFRQDLLMERVDAIVNPANTRLQHGGGLARIIANKAGKDLQRECEEFIRKHGELKITEVVHTTAGNLAPRIHYVIHAAGPSADQFFDESKLRGAIFNTFLNCLRYANDVLKIRSISIPAISTGVFNVPIALVAHEAFNALMTFDKDFITGRVSLRLREVNFVNVDSVGTKVFIDSFRNLLSKSPAKDDTLVPYGRSSPVRSRTSRMSGQIEDTSAAQTSTRRHTRSLSAPRQKRQKNPISDATTDRPKSTASTADNCAICMGTITNAKQLPCGHTFCRTCIEESFRRYQPKCPNCGKIFGALKGNQPRGTMTWNVLNQSVPGYEKCKTIVIDYDIPDGIQTNDHPNPGQPYYGTHRTAYLPNNKEGKEVCQLLKQAFDAGLIFTVGRSNTNGRDNMVIWNDVHHKTSISGSYGYPDMDYLKRVKQELADKGITTTDPNAARSP